MSFFSHSSFASGPVEEDPSTIVDRARAAVPSLAYNNVIDMETGKPHRLLPQHAQHIQF